MGCKTTLEKLSIYSPDTTIGLQPIERLIKQGEQKDQSTNYLVAKAILASLSREETT